MNDIDSYQVYKFEADYKIKIEEKENNFVQFELLKEDHTIGNAIQTELLENKNVIFSGYRIPHPLKPYLHIKIKTTAQSTPQNELQKSITSLQKKIETIKKSFKNEMSKN
jgi:DNA-directed RNA polymerase II subunit RPB11